ncbi:MAG: preprotein translocase subunit YajC [Alphaproteobacteria bacterium]|nr:preprotein translocase subunit YajC [Alphaproteobacteria bacterium]
MLISPAFAQAAGGGGSPIASLLPFVLIFAVFYFLLIRPQQKRAKEHRQLVDSLSKGHQVVTAGGITGKVTKAKDGDETVEVEIASGVVVNVIRQMISEVRDKDGNPVKLDPKAAAKK